MTNRSSPEYMREYQREYQPKWAAKNRNKWLYYAAQSRARRFGYEFTITPEDIVIPDRCPILGTVIDDDNRPSLDRVDNSKGYTPDNIEVMSKLANRMKSNASPEELVAFAKEMLRRYDTNV